MQNLGGRIRGLRKEKGLGQVELASQAGLSQSHLSAIERGGVDPSAGVLQRIATALTVPIDELLGSPGHPSGATHHIAAPTRATGLPQSLRKYIALCRERGAPLSDDQVWMLARITYHGRSPSTVDDWHYILESIKRAIGEP